MKNLTHHFYTLGLLSLALSMAVLSSGYASAATTNYSQTMTATKWRNAQLSLYTTYPVTPVTKKSGWVALGPAEWTVAGTYGSSSYTEKWTVAEADWDNIVWLASGFPEITLTGEYATSSTKPTSSLVSVSYASDFAQLLYPAGLYGANTNGSSNNTRSLRSMPTKWTITGTITTP